MRGLRHETHSKDTFILVNNACDALAIMTYLMTYFIGLYIGAYFASQQLTVIHQ